MGGPARRHVRIEGAVELENPGGDGVYAEILRNADAVWPSRLVPYGDRYAHDLTIPVKQGDSIRFVVKQNGEKPADKGHLEPGNHLCRGRMRGSVEKHSSW